MDAWSWSPWGFLKVGDPQSSRCCWFKRVCTVYLIARRTARWTARLRFQAFHVSSTFWVALGNNFFFHHYILHVYPVVYLSLFTKFSSRDPQPRRATLVDGKQIEKVFSKPLEISQTWATTLSRPVSLGTPGLFPIDVVLPHHRHLAKIKSSGRLFLEPLQRQNEQLGVVLVVQGWEGNGSEFSTLQPVNLAEGMGPLGSCVWWRASKLITLTSKTSCFLFIVFHLRKHKNR